MLGVAEVYNVSAREAKEAVDKALEDSERYLRRNNARHTNRNAKEA